MDSIVETSSNSMAEDFSRSKLSTAGGHGLCLISRKKCLRSCGASCFEIASRLICLPCFSLNQDCKQRMDVLVLFLVFSETILSLKETSSSSV